MMRFFLIVNFFSRFSTRAKYTMAVLSIVISAALWGSEGVPVRMSYSHGMNAVTLAFFRATFASIIMIFFSLLHGRKDVLRIKRQELIPCIVSGAFGVALCSTAGALAMGRIHIGLTFLLINTAPFWVMILARIFWNEAVTIRQVFALLIGISGIWIAVGGIHYEQYNIIGIIGALSAGFGYAVYILNGRHGIGHKDPLKAYVQMFIWGAIVLFIFLLLTGKVKDLVIQDWQAWLSVLYLTLFPGILSFGILMVSLRFVPGGVAAIVSMIEIPFSMLWSWIFLAEIPTFNALKGGLLIVGAVIMLTVERRKPVKRFLSK